MLQTIKIKSFRSRLKKYPFQLTAWMPEMEKCYTDPFKQHNEEDKAVILHSSKGFAVFTTGELRIEPYKS